MRTAKTASITLPPDLLAKAQEVAEREHRTMNELFGEALRRYMQSDSQGVSLLKRTRAKGQSMAIKTEADVERVSDEYPRDKSKMKRAPQLEELAALKADIDKGLTNLAEGRLKSFNATRIVQRGKKLLSARSRSA